MSAQVGDAQKNSVLREEMLNLRSDGSVDKLEARSNTTAADSVETSSVGSESYVRQDSHYDEKGHDGTISTSLDSTASTSLDGTVSGSLYGTASRSLDGTVSTSLATEALAEDLAADVPEDDDSEAESAHAGGEVKQEKVFVPVPLDRRTPQWSVGATNHHKGECNPCVWFWKARGCSNEEACEFCHTCPPGMVKQRKQEKIRRLKMERREQRARLMKAQSQEWRNALAAARSSQPQLASVPTSNSGLARSPEFNNPAVLGHAGMPNLPVRGQVMLAQANNVPPLAQSNVQAWQGNNGSNRLPQQGSYLHPTQQQLPMGLSQPAPLHPEVPAYVNVQAPPCQAGAQFTSAPAAATSTETWLSSAQQFEAPTQRIATAPNAPRQQTADWINAAQHIEATCDAVQQVLAVRGVSMPKEEVLEWLAHRQASTAERAMQAAALPRGAPAPAPAPAAAAWPVDARAMPNMESRNSYRNNGSVACPAPGLSLPQALVLSL